MTPILPTPEGLAAARHVLASPSLAARLARHVGERRIDWYSVLADSATMSPGERLLVDLARRFYAGERVPSLFEVIGRLDVLNARRVAEALDLLDGVEPAQLRRAA